MPFCELYLGQQVAQTHPTALPAFNTSVRKCIAGRDVTSDLNLILSCDGIKIMCVPGHT